MPVELIRGIIEKKDMSEKDFAESLGIAPAQFSRYMNGHVEPSGKTMRKLFQLYPELESEVKRESKGESMSVKPVYFIELDTLDYIVRYNTDKHLVLKSSQPDKPAVRIRYSNIEYLES